MRVSYDLKNNILNFLLGNVRTTLLEMVSFSADEKQVVVDLGCGKGNLTQKISAHAQFVIGVDVCKDELLEAKKSVKKADFICADLPHLPFKKNFVDVAVVASVYEFIENVEGAIEETRNIMKKGGVLIVGYPIQTTLSKTVIEIVDKRSVRMWEPHKVMTPEQCRMNSLTHKQTYQTIREFLGRYFYLLEREKIPSKYLPDLVSFYECDRMVKIEDCE